MKHGLSKCVTKRDLVLFDLIQAHYTIYQFQIGEMTQGDYTKTQAWAQKKAQQTVPFAPVPFGARLSSRAARG
jgi:hypothetical protein